MAAINDLISQIENPELRDRILAELDRMNKQKKFGLVFEEHLPETGISVDILESHDSSKIDNLPKAKGFAQYVKENMKVISIQLIRQLSDKTTGKPKFKRLNLSDCEVQKKIALANSDEDLTRIFEEKGCVADYRSMFCKKSI